ncbi:hypothetical protein QBC36DRAFT_316085 [Triangularia setosa]|uniref:Uncharacterized protein n=1 Tax=Triangularia setosa TaxID=2587417 RepID=A0AAN6VXG1_9PEZI|nr:hypothetical protein QBC36DRAFT_316085 [Podospora setosa]
MPKLKPAVMLKGSFGFRFLVLFGRSWKEIVRYNISTLWHRLRHAEHTPPYIFDFRLRYVRVCNFSGGAIDADYSNFCSPQSASALEKECMQFLPLMSEIQRGPPNEGRYYMWTERSRSRPGWRGPPSLLAGRLPYRLIHAARRLLRKWRGPVGFPSRKYSNFSSLLQPFANHVCPPDTNASQTGRTPTTAGQKAGRKGRHAS